MSLVMAELSFNIPVFPIQGRFSDPFGDFEGMEDELSAIAAKPPATLTSKEHYLIFNSFLPAGSFEEMTPYIPHALHLLQNDVNQYSDEAAPNEARMELLESLMAWCYVEKAALERHPLLRDGIQDAFMQLFRHWTSETRWCRFSDGRLFLLNSWLVDQLLEGGDSLVCNHQLKVYPWLRSEHYLPHITELDTIPHAAWTLWVSVPDNGRSGSLPAIELPSATRRRAVEIVEQWLLTDAKPEDIEIWDPVLIRHREQLYLFSDKP